MTHLIYILKNKLLVVTLVISIKKVQQNVIIVWFIIIIFIVVGCNWLFTIVISLYLFYLWLW